jgi:hypothetical protein
MSPLRVVGELPADVLARVAVAPSFATLAEVLRWGDIVDVIVQDEYTHDVVVRGPAAAYVCFDTT